MTRVAIAFLFLTLSAGAADRQVAITIDDLPRGGDGGGRTFPEIQAMTNRLLAAFREGKVPVTGFVNPGRSWLSAADLRAVLNLWLDAGAELGNHTWLHKDLNDTSVADYKQEIMKADAVLRPIVEARGRKLDYFRYPFLHAGPTAATKRAIAEFLAAQGYRNAPVTFDDADYMFAAAYTQPELRERAAKEYLPCLESVVEFFERRSVAVLGHEFPQVLLLHASELNSRQMPDILTMFRRRGYRFLSLAETLRDPAYSLPENYTGTGGFSWIHRWSMAKGMPNQGEPDEPAWLHKWFTEQRQ